MCLKKGQLRVSLNSSRYSWHKFDAQAWKAEIAIDFVKQPFQRDRGLSRTLWEASVSECLGDVTSLILMRRPDVRLTQP